MPDFLKKNNKIVTFTLWLGIAIYLISVNVNFRDTAQAWLIARDCNLLELVKQLQYEGHMSLWYLILMPFAKLGFPYITTNIISLTITAVSVLLILYKAPFKFVYKALLIFTTPFLYTYPVISRCYCLLPLAIALMAITYEDRKKKPYKFLLSVVLLANVHVVTLGMVGVVLFEYMLEIIRDIKNEQKDNIKERIIWLLIAGILLVISGLPLLGCFRVNCHVKKKFSKNSVKKLLDIPYTFGAFIYMLFKFQNVNKFIILFLNEIIFVAVLLIIFEEIEKKSKDIIRIFLCVLWQILLYIFIYSSAVGQQTFIILIVLYYKWISNEKTDKKNICQLCIICILVLGVISSMTHIYDSKKHILSNGYEMAQYINNNLDDNSIIMCATHSEWAAAIMPYLKNNIKFYHIAEKKYFTYTVWDKDLWKKVKYDDINNLKSYFDEKDKLYFLDLIHSEKLENLDEDERKKALDELKDHEFITEGLEKNVFKKLYEIKNESKEHEDYILYIVNLQR